MSEAAEVGRTGAPVGGGAIDSAMNPVQLEQPIISLPAIQLVVADMVGNMELMRSVTKHIGGRR